MARCLVIWCCVGAESKQGEVWCLRIKTNKVSLLKKFHGHFIGHPDTPKVLSKRIDKFFFKRNGKPIHTTRVFKRPAEDVQYDLAIVTGMWIGKRKKKNAEERTRNRQSKRSR